MSPHFSNSLIVNRRRQLCAPQGVLTVPVRLLPRNMISSSNTASRICGTSARFYAAVALYVNFDMFDFTFYCANFRPTSNTRTVHARDTRRRWRSTQQQPCRCDLNDKRASRSRFQEQFVYVWIDGWYVTTGQQLSSVGSRREAIKYLVSGRCFTTDSPFLHNI